MKRRSPAAIALALVLSASAANATPILRVQVNQRGDFLLIGNTLGYDCAAGTPAPVFGTLAPDACLQTPANISDSSPDVYWSADDPAVGQCLADATTPAAQARSTALLTVPAGATVTHAFLYWSAINTSGVADTSVTLDRVGPGGFGPTTVTAIQSWVPGLDNAYQSVADVTALVQQYGTGAYRVSDIDVAPFANVDVSVLYGGWWMVAFYQLPSDPLRNLTLFDDLDVVSSTSGGQSVTLSGFLVPSSGFDGKLGVVAFEGDNTATGDALLFNGATLSDAQNPANNFFNSTRSWLGAPVSVVGDLPQLTGTAQSMGGVDIDVVDISAHLTAGQSSAPVQATTASPVGDTYYLGGFVMSISTLAPDFSTSTKTATDVNGGLLVPGDVITYSVAVTNSGSDASVLTTVSDPLPAQVTFVPGSIKIDGVANTDAAGDDEAEYVATTRTVTARLGTGATAALGGSIATGASSVVTFQVTVNAGVVGDVANQATISAGGTKGAAVGTWSTDGNGAAMGTPPTVVTVSQCMTDVDCGDPTSGVVCDTGSSTCVPGCRGVGGNGCPTGQMCSSTTTAIGTCGPITSGSSSSSASSSSSSSSSSASSASSSSASSSTASSSSSSTSSSSSNSSSGSGGAGGGGAVEAAGALGTCDACAVGAPRDADRRLLGAALAALAVGLRRARRAKKRAS